jgi:hypothetical protein
MCTRGRKCAFVPAHRCDGATCCCDDKRDGRRSRRRGRESPSACPEGAHNLLCGLWKGRRSEYIFPIRAAIRFRNHFVAAGLLPDSRCWCRCSWLVVAGSCRGGLSINRCVALRSFKLL